MSKETSPDLSVADFLRGRSAPCPKCGYDLRDLTTDTCPECGARLLLRLGHEDHVPRNWLIGLVILAMNLGFPVVFAGFVFFSYIRHGEIFLNDKELWGIIGLLILFLGLTLTWIRRRRWLEPLDRWPGWMMVAVGLILTGTHAWFFNRML